MIMETSIKISNLRQLAAHLCWLEIFPDLFRDDKKRLIREISLESGKGYKIFSFNEPDKIFNTLEELIDFYNTEQTAN